MMLQAGKLRHYVEVQEQSSVKSAAGGITDQWTKLFDQFAQVRPVRGREAYIADQLLSELSHVVVMRWSSQSSAITVKNRIIYDNRIFQIQNIIDVEERKIELRFYCVEIQ